ncbi:outer membrane receptor protein involved in Fe transport [Flavobacterium croceum DSM 17960]|uniref:Outer membrane receptor protein involved in Fe transport n=1 Tax=Flavobacterium croceum DSM 17960 TaxID=1121886 RepID=A0A2S4N860_9FLAO|nr:TonB-dependent receptor [Flavobacterium croceum]POS01880.1 outer membrane receptor protein involved in Fe transport [Flavobacterium croceum DSM 17960]
MKIYHFILTLLCCGISMAQTTISGSVKDSKNEPVPAANIKVVGDAAGTVSDGNGKFSLKTNKKPPFTIQVSSIGYATQKVEVASASQNVVVTLESSDNKLDEIVISASRTPERILESPVTIERMGLQDIKKTSSANYYEGLENLKEVHFNTSSMSFKSINTRGFSTIANTRFMQLVDNMDNSSPALNFPLGNLVGISELDIQSVELLPGASSALYGANAFNGILFMNSKSPFTNQGLSFYAKYGQTTQEVAGTNDYWDFGIRAAHAFTKHFALKGNFTFMKAKEWMADDQTDVNGGAIGHTANRNYNGMNVYGDEASTFINNVGQVSRTGYAEKYLTDNNIHAIKADFAAHIKPWADDKEIILQHKIGMGNTIYQGASKYMLKNFIMQQTRAEFKGKNFFVRGYMSTEDAGDSYDMQFAALNINRAAKSDTGWFTDYATMFLQSQIFMGVNATQADALARNWANNNINPTPLPLVANGQPQFQPGTPQFETAYKQVVSDPDLRTGAKFLDNSKLYHADANYNFRDEIKFAEIQIGGSYRKYIMNSQGTIFTDFDGPLKYDEYGAYTQIQKKVMDDRIKLTGSVRYDKSKNFEGQFSPRVSVVYSAGATKSHNFRVSFQTGFRNPTTQDQYIGLNIGAFALIGSAPDNLGRYTETQNVSTAGQLLNGGQATVDLNGYNAYDNAFTSASVAKFRQTGNVADLQKSSLGYIKPEQVKAFEVGYKSSIKGFGVDLNAYYNIYNNFSTTARVYAPYYGNVSTDVATAAQALSNGDARLFQVYSNSVATVNSLGLGAGLSKKVYKNFELGANYNYAQFDFNQDEDPSFISYFNTPKHRVKASLSNTKLFKNFGFNINWRWSEQYKWESSFADGMIPSISVFDAQASYALPALKSVLKVSGTNIGGKDYLQVVGAGRIGQQWLVSWTINP